MIGILTIAFSVLLTVARFPGTNPIIWLVGRYAVVVGALMLGLAIQLFRTKRTAARTVSP